MGVGKGGEGEGGGKEEWGGWEKLSAAESG